jgi:hypothetical protein
MLMMNIHHPPAEGNFCHGHGDTLKPATEQDYSKQMGYMDKCDHITNNWMKKLFFHSLDLSILNSFILLISCGSK